MSSVHFKRLSGLQYARFYTTALQIMCQLNVPTKVEKDVDTLEDLKTIIKDNDLGIRVTKTDTREKVEAKIKEAQKK